VHRDDCSNAVAWPNAWGAHIDVEWDGSVSGQYARCSKSCLRPVATPARRLEGRGRVSPQYHLEFDVDVGLRIVRMVFDVELATDALSSLLAALRASTAFRCLPTTTEEQEFMSDAVTPFQAHRDHDYSRRTRRVGGRRRDLASSPIATASSCHHADVRRRRRVNGASAKRATSPRKRCTCSQTAGSDLRVAPGGYAPVVRAFIQHNPRRRGGLVRDTGLRYERPRPGAIASTTNSASRCSAPMTRVDVEVIALAERFYRALG